MEHFKARSGSFKLPAPIGFIPLQEAVGIVGQKMGGDADIERTIAEACEAGEIRAAYRSWTTVADELDRRVWQMTHWRNYFATGTIDLYGLPLLDDNGHPVPDGRTVPVCTREIFVRKDSLDRFVASIEPNSKPAASRGGRKPVYDWPKIRKAVFELMDHHGEFSPDDPKWNAQARLEEVLSDRFEVAISTLRERLPKFLEDWRNAKVGN